jgi:flagellar hook-associated protein 3 FlgL
LGWLGTIDQTLTNALDYTRRARDLSVQAVNGATGPDSKRALAMEIYALRDSLIGLANTEHLGRPVFGGTAADVKPYAADGTFQIPEPAASGIVERAIAPNERVKVNVNGPAVFGADPNNLFNVLTDLADDLMAGDVSNMAGHLNALDARTGNIIDALGEVGARYNRVETMKQRADDQAVTLRGSLSEVEDIDLPATIMDMQLQETAYKAALSATARVLQPSLVDFLR